jgi:hypothetical protein
LTCRVSKSRMFLACSDHMKTKPAKQRPRLLACITLDYQQAGFTRYQHRRQPRLYLCVHQLHRLFAIPRTRKIWVKIYDSPIRDALPLRCDALTDEWYYDAGIGFLVAMHTFAVDETLMAIADGRTELWAKIVYEYYEYEEVA